MAQTQFTGLIGPLHNGPPPKRYPPYKIKIFDTPLKRTLETMIPPLDIGGMKVVRHVQGINTAQITAFFAFLYKL